jgi:DNA helicase-2/ATP-dependent DNA helicase PcrA
VSDDLALERGQGVRHPTLGSGVILEVDGSGDNAKLTVFFDRGGKRRLIAKYAGLRPL